MSAPAVTFTDAPASSYLDGVRDGETAGLIVGRAQALTEVAAVQDERRRRRIILAAEGVAVGLGWVLGSLLAQAAER